MSTPLIVTFWISPWMSTSTKLDTAHDGATQVDSAESGAGQVDGAQLRAAEVDPLEPRATEIDTKELSHANDVNVRCRRRRRTWAISAISISGVTLRARTGAE
jgi:hypothetical protein